MKKIALIALLAIGLASTTTAFAHDKKAGKKEMHKEHKGGKHHEKKAAAPSAPAE